MGASPLDIFVLVSGSFSILATLPLIYLALRGYRDGRELRVVQREVAALMTDSSPARLGPYGQPYGSDAAVDPVRAGLCERPSRWPWNATRHNFPE